MELKFNKLEEYLQSYMDFPPGTAPCLEDDLNKVSPAQRLGFIEKYMEFISPKQLRRGTSTPSGDKSFILVEVQEK